MIKFIKVIAMAILIIFIIIFLKFKPAYLVTLNGEEVGYVTDKKQFQSEINDQILTTNEKNVAFVALDNVNYKLQLVTRNLINENTTLESLKLSSIKVYRVYEISDENSQNIIYTNTIEDAENLVKSLESEYKEVTTNFKITPLYLNNEISDESIQEAKNEITAKLETELAEKKRIDSKSVNGIYLACLPLTGTITSRFGSRESIRNHTHKGLDISANYGASIKAVADGTVISAGWNSGGYGNLVIIDHGNGVTTYYGHCSKVCVEVGQKLSAGEVIAKVGSTGNSTGNHLHFEIRVNDEQIDPQNYIYN